MARGYQGTSKADVGFNSHQRTLRNNPKEVKSREVKVETLAEQFARLKKEKAAKEAAKSKEEPKKEEKVLFTPTSEGYYGEDFKADENPDPWNTLTGQM